MFSTAGAFRKIACPAGHGCQLLNCIFGHEDTSEVKSEAPSVNNQSSRRSLSLSPPPKRRKLSRDMSPPMERQSSSATNQNSHVSVASVPTPLNNLSRLHRTSQTPSSATTRPGQQKAEFAKDATPAAQLKRVSQTMSTNEKTPRPNTEGVKSLLEEVEPPPITRHQPGPSASTFQAPITANDAVLRPREIIKQPVPFHKRLDFLKKLHKVIDLTNTRLIKALPKQPEMRMTTQEVVVQALNDEESAANKSTNADTYQQAISNTMVKFNKMIPSTWAKFMLQTWRKPTATNSTSNDKNVVTGLTLAQEIIFVRSLATPVTGLEQYGYVTSPPSEEAIHEATEVVKSMGNYETCDRCNTRFQVFPGRNEAGELVSGGLCRYHWARSVYKKGLQENTYPCCGLATHIGGCVVAKNHVFKVSDKNRLAAQLQFEETPTHNDSKIRGPVTYDCEMVYTTLGMELARLTAMSWPDKRPLIDVLVRPYGEILDFNTRFSGVTVDMYSKAKNYENTQAKADTEGTPSENGDITRAPLQRVASPAAARALLFDLLNPDTPLIGHAIDNDLNTCRIIHPTIIDTVLLYPHPRGLPIRYRLKDLAAKYLQRDIQTGGAAGHDSKEDSEATGDLVLHKIREEWRKLKGVGWSWNGDVLVSPADRAAVDSTNATSKI